MDERTRRLTENELLFREVNERIDDVASGLGGEETVYEFVCECSRPDCVDRVSLTLGQYGRIRARPLLFILVDGHEVTEIERVVDTVAPGVVAVEKIGDAASLVAERARRTDR
ncbi:MAG TPA: hypothetical protein VG709_03415 [Actinomycetota bacterium]|nr:hypothetical protein [Actinomycetota bacterium]